MQSGGRRNEVSPEVEASRVRRRRRALLHRRDGAVIVARVIFSPSPRYDSLHTAVCISVKSETCSVQCTTFLTSILLAH
jgi:hypothetical protein